MAGAGGDGRAGGRPICYSPGGPGSQTDGQEAGSAMHLSKTALGFWSAGPDGRLPLLAFLLAARALPVAAGLGIPARGVCAGHLPPDSASDGVFGQKRKRIGSLVSGRHRPRVPAHDASEQVRHGLQRYPHLCLCCFSVAALRKAPGAAVPPGAAFLLLLLPLGNWLCPQLAQPWPCRPPSRRGSRPCWLERGLRPER